MFGSGGSPTYGAPTTEPGVCFRLRSYDDGTLVVLFRTERCENESSSGKKGKEQEQ